MASKNPNMKKIIRKLLSDPRIAETVVTVLIDILSDMQQTETKTAKTPQVQKEKVIDWSKKSSGALRAAYTYRKKHKIAIEPELNTELAARFAGYDAMQQKFTGRGGKRKSQSTTQIQPVIVTKTQKTVDWSSKSNGALRAAYTYRKKHNMAIEPELNTELATRFTGYDSTQMKFTNRGGKRKTTKTRVINWSEKSDDILRKAQKQRSKTVAGVDDELNTELARRFPTEYDPTTRSFIKKKHIHDFATKTAKAPSNTTIARRPTPVAVQKITPTTKPSQLSVTLKPVKQSLDATFYNVYVNGKLILRNHGNTKLELFGDGTLLGVYGIVTTDSKLPQRPLWLVYNTDLIPNKWGGQDKFSGYSIYTKSILPSPTGVNLTLSNRCTVLLDNERLKRLAGLTRFEIVR